MNFPTYVKPEFLDLACSLVANSTFIVYLFHHHHRMVLILYTRRSPASMDQSIFCDFITLCFGLSSQQGSMRLLNRTSKLPLKRQRATTIGFTSSCAQSGKHHKPNWTPLIKYSGRYLHWWNHSPLLFVAFCRKHVIYVERSNVHNANTGQAIIWIYIILCCLSVRF